jgi:hypothetical protein
MPNGTLGALLAFSACPGLQRTDQIDPDVVKRYEAELRSSLLALKEGARFIRRNKVGNYHTLDKPKHFSAVVAFELMVGLEAEQPTNGDPFRFITNALFEIVAPDEVRRRRKQYKDEPDLRRHCGKVLANWRRDPEYLKRHTEQLKRDFARMIAGKDRSYVNAAGGD